MQNRPRNSVVIPLTIKQLKHLRVRYVSPINYDAERPENYVPRGMNAHKAQRYVALSQFVGYWRPSGWFYGNTETIPANTVVYANAPMLLRHDIYRFYKLVFVYKQIRCRKFSPGEKFEDPKTKRSILRLSSKINEYPRADYVIQRKGEDVKILANAEQTLQWLQNEANDELNCYNTAIKNGRQFLQWLQLPISKKSPDLLTPFDQGKNVENEALYEALRQMRVMISGHQP